MRILVAHNRYALRGGEDTVFEQETDLLERNGHEVRRWEVSNQGMDSEWRVSTAAECIWSRRQAAIMGETVRTWRPDIVHIHNFVARFSPAIHRAAYRHGAAVVQTVHNFRLVCLNALLLRDGHYCDLCRRRLIKWPGVRHACYRKSRAASLTLAAMLAVHRVAGTWNRVHAYIVLTDSARKTFAEEGLPERRLHRKPNFVPDLGVSGTDTDHGREGFVFVARLSEEKGINVLLEAWKHVVTTEPLVVIGDGPLMPLLRTVMATDRRIRVEGWCSRETVYACISKARAVVVCSLCSEMFPLAVVEAFANGTPVIASRTPTLEELVTEGETGLLTRVGDVQDLATALNRVLQGDGVAHMGAKAKATYEEEYTPEANYRLLMQVYEAAIAERDRIGRG